MLTEIENRLGALESKLDQMVRTGVVTATDPASGTVRVEIPDADRLDSFNLPVLFQKTLDDHFYVMPDVGEHVVCIFLPIGLSQGFVLGAFYSASDPVPVASQDKFRIQFKNGACFEHDRATGDAILDIKGSLDVHSTGEMRLWSEKTMFLDAPNIKAFERKG